MFERDGVVRSSPFECKIGDIVPRELLPGVHNVSFEVTVPAPNQYIPQPCQAKVWRVPVVKPTVYKFRAHKLGACRYE